MENFNQYHLNDQVLNAIDSIGFKKPTYIQELVLPFALKNKSLVAKGKTGSGKTHSYLIPLANKINPNSPLLQSIIITPTRELAIQTYRVIKTFFKNFKNVKIGLLTGGNDINKDNDKIANSPQILIGTPQRITKIGIDNGLLNFKYVDTLIIDEADMTLELGFLNDIDRIATLITENAQIMVFSATIPVGLKNFLRKYMKKPLIIEDDKSNNNINIQHILLPTRGKSVNQKLVEVLSVIEPYICLIFANTKKDVENTYRLLVDSGYDATIIHGDLQSRERKRNIKNSLDGRFRYIVASDIAARGIDIEGVSHVISLNLPANNLEFYTHRAGRCGRNNLNGTCICIYTNSDKESINKLESQGIVFKHKDLKDGIWKDLKPISYRTKRVKKTANELDLEIKQIVVNSKNKKVKPNYKKKVRQQIDKVKRKHKRQAIQKDIKKRIVARAIENSKNKGE